MYNRIGVDIIHIKRIINAMEEKNSSYYSALYTEEELIAAQSHAQPPFFYASRFAAKEAVFKAFGIEWEAGMEWTQIQITSDSSGALVVTLFGKLADIAQSMGAKSISVSVSYDTEYAFAAALLTIG